jgi:hypothetical protein
VSICMVGHFLNRDGWGGATRDYLRALATQTKDIVAINLDSNMSKIAKLDSPPEDIAHFFNQRIKTPEVLIQAFMPSLFYRDRRFKKNFGIMFFELEHSPENVNYRRINSLLDGLITSDMQYLHEPNININKYKVPIPFNHTLPSQQHLDLSEKFKQNKDTIMFYTVAENVQRKNLPEMILAYLEAFSARDNVVLVIKTNENISHHFEWAKARLSTKPKEAIPKIMILDKEISKEEIWGIHNTGDVYVCNSFGEAWCRPMFEAYSMNKYVLSHLSMDYLQDYNKYVKLYGYPTCPVLDQGELPYYYSSKDQCSKVELDHLIAGFIQARNLARSKETFGKQNKINLSKYGYEAVGKELMKCLGL